MKTTLDIPDLLFRQAKARAALRGISLRQFVTEALEDKVAPSSTRRFRKDEPPWMQGFGALADLKNETRRVEKRIAEAFESIEAEDRG